MANLELPETITSPVNKEVVGEWLVDHGTEAVYGLGTNMTKQDMELLRERTIFRRQRNFWEKGYTKGLKVLFPLLLICAISGFLFAGPLCKAAKGIASYLRLSSGSICAITLCLICCALYNLVDIGRIYIFFKKEYVPKVVSEKRVPSKEARNSEAELITLIKNLLQEYGKMSTSGIKEALHLQINIIKLGRIIAQSKEFEQRVDKKKKFWYPIMRDAEAVELKQKAQTPFVLIEDQKRTIKRLDAK